MENKLFTIDISGNWHERESYDPQIQTREPWIKPNEIKSFYQTLNLSEGIYSLEFEYDQFLDKKPGFSLNMDYERFEGLKINSEIHMLTFVLTEKAKNLYTAYCSFTVSEGVHEIRLQIDIKNTRVMRTWLRCIQSQLPPSTNIYAIPPETRGEYLLVHGIPFLSKELNIRHFSPYIPEPTPDNYNLFKNINGSEYECHGAKAKTAHFLGMIHNIDIANGSWYSRKGDHGYSHFIGDQAGEIIVRWMNGEKCVIPLIFGFNLWYSRPWDMVWNYENNPYVPGSEGENFDEVMFCGEEENRDIIQDNLSLVDGIKVMGSYSCNARFIFSVDLQGRPIHSIEFKGVEEMYGFPLISAVSLETSEPAKGLEILPRITREAPDIYPVSLKYIEKNGYLPGVEKLKRLFYTFVDDIPKLTAPEIPEGYFGPKYDFRGSQEAVYAATYLYYNGPECGAYIADTGTGCCSSTAKCALNHYTLGMGVWIERKPLFNGLEEWFKLYRECYPGNFHGINQMWTRGAGQLIREATAFGYDKYINSYIDWLDNALMTEATPPHWNRIAGLPDYGFKKVMVGDIEECGNRENDGHGICMWGRYMAWHWLGRQRKWNEEYWEATKASVEWIQWQLDNDTLFPGVRKDVLFTESECAWGSYDFYSSYSCLHGVGLAIRMAEQLDEIDMVKRWEALYHRLRQGILDHLTDESEFGLIWHTEEQSDWKDHAHKLVHIQLATEGYTYTPLQDYRNGDEIERRYLEIDINSYHYLMKDKNYNCLRMYGYGQGMMAQSALLLDEMRDAEQFLNMLVTHCYLPKFSRWASPEGIILHKNGKYYLPVNGYMGQDSHVADSTKAVRLMLGIDDNDPVHLRIIPRYPVSWDDMSVSEYPVLTGDSRQFIDYQYKRVNECQTFDIKFRKPVENLSVRLGPMPQGKNIGGVFFNGLETPVEQIDSGDSKWVWIHNLSGLEGRITMNFST